MKTKSGLTLIWVRRHAVRSKWVCIRSEVNSEACVTFVYILTSNRKSRPLTSCAFILTSRGHTCPTIDLWLQVYSSWPHRMMSHPQINFKAVLSFIDLARLHFCSAHKSSHRVTIDCHTPVILQLGEDKLLKYLSKTECWPLPSYFLS